MIDVSNENVSGYFLLLEMAFDTKRRVAFIQQSLVDGAVRRMADDATLAHRLVLVDKRAALLRVTLEAGFVLAQERKAAGFEFLLNICRRAFDRDPFVHFMTIARSSSCLRAPDDDEAMRTLRELPGDTGNRFPATFVD